MELRTQNLERIIRPISPIRPPYPILDDGRGLGSARFNRRELDHVFGVVIDELQPVLSDVVRREDIVLPVLDVEYKQNDILPPNDITEDWLKLVDYDPENVVKLSPVKPRRVDASAII